MKGTRLIEMVTWDPDLFKNIVLPPKMVEAGLTETVIDTIMMDHFKHICIYEEPQFFKSCLELFFRKHLDEFKRLYETVIVEYNPIENYDRFEDNHRKLKETGGYTDTKSGGYSDHTTGGYSDTGSGSDSVTNEISAMNSGGFQNDTKSTTELGTTVRRENDETVSHTDDGSLNHDRDAIDDETFHARVHGNIGVTTTQQMISQERESVQFNIFSHISQAFFSELMVQVWE